MRQRNLPVVLFVVFCLAVLIFAVIRVLFPAFWPKLFSLRLTLPTPTPVVFPTKTPEAIKIISQIETKEVIITDSGIQPKVLIIKQHDQVQFFNKSSKTIAIAGEQGGSISVAPGENLTQAYNTVGTFPYQISGTSLRGEIIVK